MSDVFQTMVVTAEHAPLARAIAAAISPEGGQGMFAAALVPDSGPDDAQPTHYVSTGKINPQFAPLLSNPAALHAAAIAAGVECTLAECEALVAESDVTTDEPFAAFARLTLKLQPPQSLQEDHP